MPTIDIRDLVVRFATEGGAVHAVRGVSFAVEPGRVLGIVGESGSGKSATCRAALRLLPSNATVSGSVSFEGRDLLRLPERELRHVRGRRIGWVVQDPMSSLNPVRSIGDQLREAITVHERVGRTDIRRRILDSLSDVGFPVAERRLGAFPHELSGGLRQRVMIAMAMINKPALLIADEPTSALDVTTQAQILELLARLTRGSVRCHPDHPRFRRRPSHLRRRRGHVRRDDRGGGPYGPDVRASGTPVQLGLDGLAAVARGGRSAAPHPRQSTAPRS
jgi:ABC-type microcin C transport system duplicated ATPase subunit YejF